MTAALHLSPRGTALARTFAAAWSALREHAKEHPDEAMLLAQHNIGHVRSAYPQALHELAADLMLPAVPPPIPQQHPIVESKPLPSGAIERAVGTDGACFVVRAEVVGFVGLQCVDAIGDDTLIYMTPVETDQMVADLTAAKSRVR
jgi:hypothetical protein